MVLLLLWAAAVSGSGGCALLCEAAWPKASSCELKQLLWTMVLSRPRGAIQLFRLRRLKPPPCNRVTACNRLLEPCNRVWRKWSGNAKQRMVMACRQRLTTV